MAIIGKRELEFQLNLVAKRMQVLEVEICLDLIVRYSGGSQEEKEEFERLTALLVLVDAELDNVCRDLTRCRELGKRASKALGYIETPPPTTVGQGKG